jgi:tRNA G37 N-methylase Trm5
MVFWLKDGIKFRHMYWPIIEIFHYGEYEPLGVEGRVVVDIGAFVGDSTIYFALKGARKVIVIEPHPGAYAEMLDNIKLNNLEGMIIPVNNSTNRITRTRNVGVGFDLVGGM